MRERTVMTLNNEDIVKKLTETSAQTENNAREIAEIKGDIKELKEEYKALNRIAIDIEVMSQSITYIKEDMTEVKDGQKVMQDKIAIVENRSAVDKAKSYDKIVNLVITAITSGIVGFVLAQVAPAIWGK